MVGKAESGGFSVGVGPAEGSVELDEVGGGGQHSLELGGGVLAGDELNLHRLHLLVAALVLDSGDGDALRRQKLGKAGKEDRGATAQGFQQGVEPAHCPSP